METVAKKYKGKAEFLFVYCREAHPEGDRRNTRTRKDKVIKQAGTPEERRAMAQEFCEDMKSARTILVDEFGENSAQRAYGGLNNPALIIGLDGRIALKMPWTNGDTIDRFLGKFLETGGKYDETLAKNIVLPGPSGVGNPGAPNPGPGGFGPRPEVMARNIERMLEGLELTDGETAVAKKTMEAKMEWRGRLRVRAVSLEEVARNKNTDEKKLTLAIEEYESELSKYREAVVELDRVLAGKVSAKAKAQLLAIGVFENGFGFIGPGNRPNRP